MAVGLGAQVTIIDKSIDRLRELDALYGNRIHTLYSNTSNIERAVINADVVIGSVLIPGASAPKLVSKLLVSKMHPGSVLVDVAIDQGGCFETSKATTHTDPTFTVDGVLHYCVANMPGAVARTSTFALTNATYPFIEALANRGMVKALSHDHHLRNGLSIHRGKLTSEPVAKAQKVDFVLAEELLAA
jgi:alanine dehydrogenase